MQNTDRSYQDNFPAQYTAFNRTLEIVHRFKFTEQLLVFKVFEAAS